ncbi:MAG: dockerin type I repeat-containing protein [candidate division Zixibacteria bacterium]|nr:dockerin type I repeat-containing protein [candidate division Zixibacteria bacterium]
MLKRIIFFGVFCVFFCMTANTLIAAGWVYPKPHNIKDTTTVSSMLWKEIWLINYDSLNSVHIDSVETSDYWITTYTDMPGVIDTTINPLDSIKMIAEFDMSGFFDEIVSAEIIIHSNGFDTTTTINCLLTVTNSSAEGAKISISPPHLDIWIEPGVLGEVSFMVYNTGDLPLNIFDVATGAFWLIPVTTTGMVTTVAPLEITITVHTSVFEDTVVNTFIDIHSDAVDFPVISLPVNLFVNMDNVGGQYHYGDVNYDGWCNEADLDYLIDYLWGVSNYPCWPASDMNGDGYVLATDATYLTNFLRGDGPAPVNACDSVTNFPMHGPDRQVYMPASSGSRGEWVTVPVYVQAWEYYFPHISFNSQYMLFDSVEIEDVGFGFSPYASIIPGEPPYNETIEISDNFHPDSPFSFPELTHIYNLRLHVFDDAHIILHQLFASTFMADRGITTFIKGDDYSLNAPMFNGLLFTVKPKISLDNISGIPNVAYINGTRNFSLSLDITSDADVACDMHIFIQDIASENIVYADTIPQMLSRGTNTYFFTIDWLAASAGNYRAGAEVLADLDDPKNNAIGKNIRITDDIYHGIPPVEDFGGAGLGLNYSPGKPDFVADLPNMFTKNNNDDENDPEWDIDTLHSSDTNDNNCVHMPGNNYFGPHDDWLIFGPLTGVEMTNPAIRFKELEQDWYSSPDNRHEFYVMHKSDFDIETALEDGAIDFHTPSNHDIGMWEPYTIFLPGSLELDDTTYFAWRYIGSNNRTPGTFDIWRVDYIEWFDSQAGDTYEYLPGDVNMHLGTWPPVIWGSDVTYLVNYFTGKITSVPCFLDGFWASADVNGYCDLTGGDVTRLVNYFKGTGNIEFCIDFYPAWPVPDSLPPTEPDGWPNCD